jgi:hypothetical protein
VCEISICSQVQVYEKVTDVQILGGEHTMMKGEQVAQIAVVCWCICRKARKAGEWIMKGGLTCSQCMEVCFKEFESRYMEYRCEVVKPPEEEEEYDYDGWGE